ncbi:glycosyl hydrolase family 20, catalytic domain-containing protein [Phthorimaea operculella]|nr:glycosyl hydrolase family 20, catalytic domain-containing protein [Phthorimaea operculella]
MILSSLVLFSVCNVLVESGKAPLIGPKHPPTKGAVWPKPQSQTFQNGYYTFDPDKFSVRVIGNNCTILSNRIRHYIYQFKQMKQIGNKYKETDVPTVHKRQIVEEIPADNIRHRLTTGGESLSFFFQEEAPRNLGRISTLRVNLLAPCEERPYLDMDESYTLDVTTSATLSSASVWGILRGLETFSQLFYFTDDFTEIRINSTEVSDAPAYKHRGLLLDTSRHYIPVKDILLTIDTLAMNKMNVFHWHIVDDQSFPYQSEKFPDLSARGAYHKSMVYTKADIESIVNYATERGVRVIPEFDVPGHTSSWGAAYPSLLTECYSYGKVTSLGPMNPTRNTTYKLLRDLFQEVQGVFPDHYIHVGGDEVELNCWQSNPEIQRWMNENNVSSTSMLHSYFMSRTLPLLQPRSEAIVWQEVYDEGVELTNSTLIHFWQNWGNPGWKMQTALSQGFRVLFSSYWYLDHLDQTFEKMLKTDPRQLATGYYRDDLNLQNLYGGEACMWGEVIDETNMHSRVWPRASAVAERLWSGPPVDTSEDTLRRIEEHTCRMKRRGVPAAPPTGPGFCLA